MPWTYLLECADGTFYVGSTVDLEHRLGRHQVGEAAAYTGPADAGRSDWCGPDSEREALIEGRYGDLPELASRSGARTPPPT